jgi:hypothetical protein
MPACPKPPIDAVQTACQLAKALEQQGQEYAFGGAIALGFWAEPRSTVDVDLTLFSPPEKPTECVCLLQAIGCEVAVPQALESLKEHGFCRAKHGGLRVDVFLPIVPFYQEARKRRARVKLEGQEIQVWSADVLAVFKMMFFRPKDLVDLQRILEVQRDKLDRSWIRAELEELYGRRDPRLSRWDELVEEMGEG